MLIPTLCNLLLKLKCFPQFKEGWKSISFMTIPVNVCVNHFQQQLLSISLTDLKKSKFWRQSKLKDFHDKSLKRILNLMKADSFFEYPGGKIYIFQQLLKTN